MLRPVATRNAQRRVPNANPQRKGPTWISPSVDGVDAFSRSRKKHPKEPYVLKGHATSKSWKLIDQFLDMGWVQVREAATLRNSPPAMCNSEFKCCYSKCMCTLFGSTNDSLHFYPTRVKCFLQGFKQANSHTAQLWQPQLNCGDSP